MPQQEFYRPFLDEVIENQSRLSKYLRELKDSEGKIDETSLPGDDLEEKKESLWTILNRSTLGLTSRFRVKDPKSGFTTEISTMIRYLLDNNNKILKIKKSGESKPISVSSKSLYSAILRRLREMVYPRAVEQSLKYAPERLEKGTIDTGGPID